jgi:hypothetical protein
MRLHGRAELWLELEHAGWLHRPSRRCSPVQAQLLDAAVLHQAPGRTARVRAAQWALEIVFKGQIQSRIAAMVTAAW